MYIRPLDHSDRSEWLRLLEALYPDTDPGDHVPYVNAFIAGTPHHELLPAAVFVCERIAGGLCGFIEVSIRNYAEGCSGNVPFIESWFVASDVRARGAGRLLVEAVEAWARERGFTEIASNALLENTVSFDAHLGVGFEVVEKTVNFRKPLQPLSLQSGP